MIATAIGLRCCNRLSVLPRVPDAYMIFLMPLDKYLTRLYMGTTACNEIFLNVAEGEQTSNISRCIIVLQKDGWLKVFTGVLPGEVSAPPSHPTPQVAATSPLWSATVFTADRLILVTLEVNPNKIGTNSFTLNLVAMRTDRAITNASVSLFTT